ncbi:MAG: aryl-alcohol dehydrogenase-like predicted oxidoreductase [Myxococcota bacterium]
MKYRLLPGTDLELSVIGFGCWPMGGEHWGDDTSDDDLIAAVHTALDQGVNWFDTAPLYGRGRAESLLARALDGRKAVIATKVGIVDSEGEHVYSDPTYARVISDCEDSLRRLNIDCIDLLQVHWAPERAVPLEESIAALVYLQEQGKIRHFGVCNYSPSELTRARAAGPVVSLQTPYSLLRRELEGPLLESSSGIGVLAYETLCRGLLTNKHLRAPTFPQTDMRRRDPRFRGQRFAHARRLLDDLSAIGQKVDAPVAALSIGWVLSQPGITAAIVGMKRPAQVHEDLRCIPLLDRERLWSVVGRVAALHGGSPAGPG